MNVYGAPDANQGQPPPPIQPNNEVIPNVDVAQQQQQLIPFVPTVPSKLDRIKVWLNQTDHVLGRFLDRIRQQFGLKPPFTFLMITIGLAIWMLNHPVLASMVSGMICSCTYPMFESIDALAQRNTDSLQLWSTYWMVYTCLGYLDALCEFTLFYWPVKTILCTYLFLPPTRYIATIRSSWLSPLLQQLRRVYVQSAQPGQGQPYVDIPLD